MGYINVDQRSNVMPIPPLPGIQFLLHDLSMMPWPFDDGSVSEILMLDVLEHFPMAMTEKILSQCWRVLEPLGQLVIQAPDAAIVMQSIVQDGLYSCTCREIIDRWPSCGRCGRTSLRIACDARDRLFGGQDYPGNFHQTCFTERMLKFELSKANFEMITDERALAGDHWNMRYRFKKVS